MCTSSSIHSQSQCDYDREEICASIDGTEGCDACMGLYDACMYVYTGLTMNTRMGINNLFL
jgi:hypothetical protein